MPITFRKMTAADIWRGLELCRAACWNQLQRDWELFLRLSPQGCRVAVKDERIVGTVTTVSYEARFAWIGMVLVDPAERGQGIGTQLLREALALLAEVKSIRLDATPAGHPVYCKLGFKDEYRLSRMQTVVAAEGWRLPQNPARLITASDLPGIVALDREVFGAERRAVLEWIYAGAPEYAWVIEQNGEVLGYTFGRHGFAFEQLGPLVAREQQTARQLVAACLQHHANKSFVIDAAHWEADWCGWLESKGFREQRPFTRMFYRDNPYPGLPPQQFGILGPEFG